MSERHIDEEDWPYEPQLIGFSEEMLGDLDEYWLSFELATQRLIGTFTAAMQGQLCHSFEEAIDRIYTVHTEQVAELEELSKYLYSSMNTDEATHVWATIVHCNLAEMNEAMTALNPLAGFNVPDIAYLAPRGQAYFEGMKKASEEGIDVGCTPNTHENARLEIAIDALGIEDLPDLLENEGFDDTDIDHLTPVKDEYGQWVIAEYGNQVGDYLDDLLSQCPEDVYPTE